MATRIYTRTGDAGETGLFGGQRVAKDDLRVEAYGAVDELNSSIGAVRSLSGTMDPDMDALLNQIQHDLFQLGADLATPETSGNAGSVQRIDVTRTKRLEAAIDANESCLPRLTNFVLPGGSAAGALLHVARTVCRRAERRCVAFVSEASEQPDTAVNPEVVRYLNRLSDLLFVLARAANAHAGVPDVRWDPGV